MSRVTPWTLALAGLLLTAALPALAGDPPKGADGKVAEKEKKEKEKPDRWFAVTAGVLHTVSGPTLRDVTVLAKNGKIVAIGGDLVVPEGAEVVDASSSHVYPGLIAFDSAGLVGTPPADATDPYGLPMTLALSTGITTVGAGSWICKLTYGTLEGHVLGKRTLVPLDTRTPEARRKLRGELEQVRDHRRATQAAEIAKALGKTEKGPDALKGKLKTYAALLSGEAVGLIQASSARALTDVANLALAFGFRTLVTGAEEAWTVAPLLGRAGVGVVVRPRSRKPEDRERMRPSGWTIENAARLHDRGVPVAIMSRSRGISLGGLAGRDLLTLPLEAAYAVRGGLSEAAALEAITLGPARFLGVADRVGSVEVGKDCDLVITRRDLLHYQTLPEWTIVNGRVAYDKERESLFRAIRSREKDGESLEIPQLWPRPADAPQPVMPESEQKD